MAIFISLTDMDIAIYWAKFFYFGSALIIPAFLAFANYYIYPSYRVTKKKVIYFLIPFLIITAIIFHPSWFLESATHHEWGNDANEKLVSHLIFAAYLFVYIILSYVILFRKFRRSEGIHRTNLSFIISGSFLSFLFGIIFALILPIAGEYSLIWVGPYFTVVNASFLVYFIFIKSR
ncbi:MAG: hypothetical protein COU22_01470 [Candidatus Komeilibacteria bacterium CG10_big_fil_rev_8_21_14_0_10_41_13]|uniref:Histidine kinase N-terminal 7TM region domain-containing protein n=1 Tax=Candidatus Komeilibacteria bacterium CG10_big_fil_rev_8_21_14_0_10_41_13 TaxID=1974476 RepID=A0A2M6WCQ3_9BACT|nr:MAG: hypothetical protein COU22_01470 [Candidatus Komeilibacteria bacterium CG10_big_fil_rev_8_21_14_0_10_41_13]